MGERERGRTVPLRSSTFRTLRWRRPRRRRVAGEMQKLLLVLDLVRCQWAALLCRPGFCRSGADVTLGGDWGVSDPHLAAPFFAPGPARRGSLCTI